ncbi:MAG: hypothetical protein ABSD71_07965 [Bacteroidales bacterium]|jgi:hypothetical protein
MMQYHIPDQTWGAVGIEDYSVYLEHYVIKGLFHKAVPKDVVDSYKVAEYIMAHSYFHYPLYNEAFSKLLRTIEMAVKQRFEQLDIPIKTRKETANSKNTLPLKSLIKYIEQKEPAKELGSVLHILRELRNLYMHPETFTYGGLIFKKPIIRTINVLNPLFLPERVFVEIKKQVKSLENKLLSLATGTLVMEYDNQVFPVEMIKIIDAVALDSKWIYCCSIIPPAEIIILKVNEHGYSNPYLFTLNILDVSKRGLSANEVDSKKELKISQTDDIQIKEFLRIKLETYKRSDELLVQNHTFFQDIEIREYHQLFLYNYLYKIKAEDYGIQ